VRRIKREVLKVEYKGLAHKIDSRLPPTNPRGALRKRTLKKIGVIRSKPYPGAGLPMKHPQVHGKNPATVRTLSLK